MTRILMAFAICTVTATYGLAGPIVTFVDVTEDVMSHTRTVGFADGSWNGTNLILSGTEYRVFDMMVQTTNESGDWTNSSVVQSTLTSGQFFNDGNNFWATTAIDEPWTADYFEEYCDTFVTSPGGAEAFLNNHADYVHANSGYQPVMDESHVNIAWFDTTTDDISDTPTRLARFTISTGAQGSLYYAIYQKTNAIGDPPQGDPNDVTIGSVAVESLFVPEPSSMMLLVLGVIGIAGMVRRR